MSPELGVLRDPDGTFRALAEAPGRGAWTLVRRPLLLLLAIGVGVSLCSSSRVSARTTFDGMISFAFIPLSQVLAIGVVYLRGDRRVPFSRVVDAFFVSNAPWLLWLLAVTTWQALAPVVSLSMTAAMSVLATLVVPIVWAGYLDLQLFRVVLSRRAVAVDLALTRGVGWFLALAYFFGIAAWAQIVAWFR